MNFDTSKLSWIRKPKRFDIQPDKVTINTEPGTDLWQRTYYVFCNDDAPVLQMETEEELVRISSL